MKRITVFAALFCSLLSAASAQTKPQPARKTLDQPTEIQGYPCQKGYAWFFADGKLKSCDASRAIAFGEAAIPAGSRITLRQDGKPGYVQMSHDAQVLGYNCMGAGLLGVGEGSVVAFYPSGKLKACFLASDQTVQGVPCSHGGIFATATGPDPGVYFYESGKLRRCRLANNYGAQHRGDLFTQQP